MSSREARAAALAKKKAKLAALKAKHAARTQAAAAGAAAESSSSVGSKTSEPLARRTSAADVNRLVDDLLAAPIPAGVNRTMPSTPPLGSGSATDTAAATIPAVPSGPSDEEKKKTKYAALTLTTSVSVVHIPGRQADMYDKGTQTDAVESAGAESADADSIRGSSGSPRGVRSSPSSRGGRRRPSMNSMQDSSGLLSSQTKGSNAGSSASIGGSSMSDSAASVAEKSEGGAAEDLFFENARKILDATELMSIESSDPFTTFLSMSSGIVERALDSMSSFDPTVHYGTRPGDDDVREESESKVIKVREYFDERLCGGRSVTDLAWSPHYKELCLTAMGARDRSMQKKMAASREVDSDGMVLVWSLHRHQAPEFKFSCQSPVTTAKFDPFSPNLIVGATFSGQVVLWDKRAKSQPVQRTPLSASGHTHPVFSLEVVGSANANKLVTISTDGRMCSWSLSSLSEPSDSTILTADNKSEVAVTAMSFAAGDANEFCAGAENGSIYAAQVHGQKSGQLKKYEGHYGPVTSLMFHPGHSHDGLSGSDAAMSDDLGSLADHSGRAKSLLLSSSVDWTVRLWSHQPRDGQHPLREVTSFRSARDYVYDVRWSPVNPGMFAYVDGSGWLHVWDVNVDMEEPVVKIQATDGCAAVKVRFAGDGKGLIVGDSMGVTHFFSLNFAAPSPSSWLKLSKLNTGSR